MVQQICPHCRDSNPMENRYCGQCGASLTQLVPHGRSPLVVRQPGLPVPQLKQVGQTVAVGLLAIAAEAGLKWLQRRLNEPETIQSPPANKETAVATAVTPHRAPQGVTAVYQEETIETQEWTRHGWVRRTITRAAWWRP